MSRTLSLILALLVIIGALFAIRLFNDKSPAIAPIKNDIPPSSQVSTSNDVGFHKWREFSSQSGRFKVLLPALPQHVTDSVTDPETKEVRLHDTYVSADPQGLGFMISAIHLPKPVEPQKIESKLKEIVSDILARNKDNQLLKMNFEGPQNNRSLNFVLTNGDINVEGKVFVHDNVFYVLSMVNRADSFNQSEFDFFINSFDIQKESQTPNGDQKTKGESK